MNLKDVLSRFMSDFREVNPHIPAQDFDQLWSEVEAKVESEPPPRIALIGECGVGKSTTLNSLFNAGVETSDTEACTQLESAHEITLNTVRGERGVLVVYDMPGLGESRQTRGRHLDTYERVLKEVDVALWVLDAQYRAMEQVQNHLEETVGKINKKLLNRMVFGLNKVDLVQPGQTAWHPLGNLPSPEQEANINARVSNVRKLIKEEVKGWEGEVIAYSADRRYNLPQLFAAMLDAVPEKRRWVLASRKALADFLALVDPRLLPSATSASPKDNKHKPVQPLRSVEDALAALPEDDFARITANKQTFVKWARSLNHDNGGDDV